MATFFHADATITDGTINSTVIGNSDPDAGTFTVGIFNTSLASNAFDARTATTLVIGATTATKVEIGKASVETEIGGPLDIIGLTTVNDIDTRTATTLLLGKSTATKVEIADTGVDTEIQGNLNVQSIIDTASATSLQIGLANATSVTLGATDANTSVLGKTLVRQGPAGTNTGIDTIGVGVLAIGGETATTIQLGATDADTSVLGGLLVRAGTAAANTGIDTATAGTLAVGGDTATKVEIADTGVTTEVQGNLTVQSIIDTVSATSLQLGPANATGVSIGATDADTLVLGKLVARQGAAGANIGIDTAGAGILAIGGETATSVQLGATDANTLVLGKTVVRQGAAGTNTGIDTNGAGILAIGGETATSLELGATDTDTSVLGKTLVRQGPAGANVGIDTIGAGVLAVGGETATSVQLGATDANTLVLGKLVAREGAAGTNTGIDTAGAGILAVGGEAATSVQLGATDANTSILGGLLVRAGSAGTNVGIDTATAGTLALGGDVATKVEIADTGVTTEVQGNLSVLQNAVITGNLTVNGTMTTVNSENLNIVDSSILLNDGYISESPHVGSIVIITDPEPGLAQTTVAVGGFTAAGGSGPTVSTTTNPFTNGDLVLITGASNTSNNGLYQVDSSTGVGPFLIQMRSTVAGTIPSTGMSFVQNNFTTDTTVAGTLTRVNVSVLQASTTGQWGTAYGKNPAAFAIYNSLIGGPTSSTDNAIVRFNGTTGGLVQDSLVTIADTTGIINIASANGNLQINGTTMFPTSSVDNTLVRFTGTTGRAVQESGVVVDDSNNMSGIVNLTNTGCAILGGSSQTVRLNALGAVAIVTKDILTNADYNSDTAVTGGLVTIYDPTTTQAIIGNDSFNSTSTVVTDDIGGFAAGDIIQIVGANNPQNDGIFEVVSSVGGLVTIDTTPVETFSKNAFVVDNTPGGVVTKVNVSHIRSGTDGNWEVAKGSTTPLVYTDLSAGLTGSGATNRLTKWSSTSALTDSAIVIDSNSNLDMSSASARHIIRRNESYSLATASAQSPSANCDITFVTVTDATVCTGTLANGTFTGQEHIIIASSIFTGGRYDMTVTNFQPGSGTAGSKVLQFSNSGQSVHLVFNGTNWLSANSGVTVV